MSALACPKLRSFEPHLLRQLLKLPPGQDDLVEDCQSPGDLLSQLRDRELWPQVMRHLAYGLPERESVWWSCTCVRHTARELPTAERAAVEAAEAWVWRPEAEERRAAAAAVGAAGHAAPGAWCSIGAALSHRPRFSPGACGGRGAFGAISRAAARDGAGPAQLRRRHLSFLASGLDIGNGGAGRLPAERGGDARETAPCPSP